MEHEKDKATQFRTCTTTGQVYAQVVADLNLAVEQLTVSPQPDRFRAPCLAEAGVLLSRTLLYMQRWASRTGRQARGGKSAGKIGRPH